MTDCVQFSFYKKKKTRVPPSDAKSDPGRAQPVDRRLAADLQEALIDGNTARELELTSMMAKGQNN